MIADTRDTDGDIAAEPDVCRELNDRITALTARAALGVGLVICECDDRLCAESVEITPGEYDAVRAHGARFVVSAGHEHPGCRVVGGNSRFQVVERSHGGATGLVRALDADGGATRGRTLAVKWQVLFRDVNERIESLHSVGPRVEFICECADETCTEAVALSIDEYENVRRRPVRFVVLPGHDDERIERVVEQNDRYAVVEKFGAAGDSAIERDPRRRRRAGPPS
jgi:hypothetical protein